MSEPVTTSAALDSRPAPGCWCARPVVGLLIALSACLQGEPAYRLARDDETGAREAAGRYKEIFGRENYLIEIQDAGLSEQAAVNPATPQF